MSAPNQQTDDRPHHRPEDEPHEEGQVVAIADIGLLAGAEIDKMISTAHHYPRDMTVFRRALVSTVTMDEATAQACIYSVPRDGKMIVGPSARFAEILAYHWGNNRQGGRIVGMDDEFVTGQGFFFDLEKNSAITYEIKRRITTKTGAKFGADMIMTTGNAATSIAHRNAVLKGIPKAIWGMGFDRAKAVIAGDFETLRDRRIKVMQAFGTAGATPEQVFGLLGVGGIDSITLEHMVQLAGVLNSIRDGEESVEEIFRPDRLNLKDGVAPRQPQRSEFTRQPDKKPEETKLAVEAVTGSATSDQEKAIDDQRKLTTGASNQNTDAWQAFKDAAAERLSETRLLKEVAAVRDNFAPEFVDDPADKAWWEKLCDARQKAVMEERMAATGSGKKK